MSTNLSRSASGRGLSLVALMATLVVAACSGSTATTSPTATAAAQTAYASPSTPASPSPSAASPSPVANSAAPSTAASGLPASVDPCQLVTQDEASKLAGVSLGSGKSETTSGGARSCTYGGQTLNVFNVVVALASDPTTAQADWSQEQARAQDTLKKTLPAGVNLDFKTNEVSNVAGADRAAVATLKSTISGVTIEVTGIYLLKGSYFLSFSDLALGHNASSQADMEAQATTSLGRLP